MLFPIYDENPTQSMPWITLLIIVSNIFVFVYELSLQSSGQLQQLIQTAALIPYQITHMTEITSSISNMGVPTLITSMFLHAGWLHIIGNMWYLWIFGNNVEDALGHFKYLFFYLACGLGGGVLHILSQPNSQVPTLGASGAIAGVLAAYLILFPNTRVVTIVPIFFFIQVIRVPALLLIGLWFIIQLASGIGTLSTTPAGGTAWFAHVGGFIAGLLLILILRKRRLGSNNMY